MTAVSMPSCPLVDGLPSGLYQVVETNPDGYYSVADADGGNPDNISPIALSAGDDVVDQDFEDQPYGDISGTVYDDLNGNGVMMVANPASAAWKSVCTKMTAPHWWNAPRPPQMAATASLMLRVVTTWLRKPTRPATAVLHLTSLIR